MPAMHVATELEAVTGSTPVAATISVPEINRNRYSTTKDKIEILVLSAMFFPFSLVTEIELG
jgi:hypothetical protein